MCHVNYSTDCGILYFSLLRLLLLLRTYHDHVIQCLCLPCRSHLLWCLHYGVVVMVSHGRGVQTCPLPCMTYQQFNMTRRCTSWLVMLQISGVTRSMVTPGPETEVIGESGSGGLGDAEKGLILHVLRIS